MIQRMGDMTMTEFIRRYDGEGPFEIIDGEVIPVSPTVARHVMIAKRLFLYFLEIEKMGLGEVFLETPYILPHDPNAVQGSRVPDVMFVLKPTMTQYRASIADSQQKPFIFVPEIVAEIVSPTDNQHDVERKVARYQADGVRLIWVIDPQRGVVTVSGEMSAELTRDDTLSGGDVLPCFEMLLSDLFGGDDV